MPTSAPPSLRSAPSSPCPSAPPPPSGPTPPPPFLRPARTPPRPERRATAKRAHAEGHWIGNHTMTHSTPLGRLPDPGKAIGEILETQALIDELAHPDRLFRPFGGGGELGRHLLNTAAIQVLESERMTCVLWNAIPRDWEDPRGWAEVALAQCLAQPWTLLVLHDLPTGAMG